MTSVSIETTVILHGRIFNCQIGWEFQVFQVIGKPSFLRVDFVAIVESDKNIYLSLRVRFTVEDKLGDQVIAKFTIDEPKSLERGAVR